MPFDSYSACPGGTGKKIKFCCSDLIGELEKVQRMIEGEQFVACLDHVAKLDATHPNRPCLLSWRLLLEQMTGNREKATDTLAAFVAAHPNNPIALAEAALLRVQQGDARVGIDMLQQAIELSGDQLHERVYAAIGGMGEMLILSQHLLPARAHLLLQIAMTGGADEHPVQLLMRLESAPSMPVLLKETPMYSEAPPDVPWHNAFDEALRLAARGQWRAAEARWKALVPETGGSAALWQNLAIVRGNLGDYAGCVDALHHVASLDVPAAVSLDDAVEAEALAQLLDQNKAEGTVDSVLVTFAVRDVDELERRLASDKQADATEIDTRVFAEAQQPPPRAAYWLLDRPLVASGAELSREQIPQILGQVLLFGKQTDREARLELDVHRPYLDRARRELTRIAGEAIGNQQSEEVTGSMSAVQLAMSWQWRLPSDMSEMHRRKLISDERRALVLDRWPSLPLPLLAAKAPSEAASDPANRARLLGAILLLEQSDANPAMAPAYDELRRKLHLPIPEPIDPSGIDVTTLRLVRMPRLLVERLSDEQLQQVFRRLAMVGYEPAMRRIAAELVGRASPALLEYKHAAYQYLVHGEEDTQKALEWIEAGRKTAEQLHRSTASWDLDELTMRVQRQDGPETAQLIMHIRNEHGREPGVAEALFGILARLGMVGPDGTLMIPATAPGTTPPGIVVPGTAAEAGKLWTPESQTPAGKKSALWVPE